MNCDDDICCGHGSRVGAVDKLEALDAFFKDWFEGLLWNV
jgi:hypothetical protein